MLVMVFAGQDAWRKHPLITGCWKQPFPHIKLAAGLFAAYLVASTAINIVMKPPESGLPHKSLTKYKKANEFGDTMPEGGLRPKHH